MAVPRVVDARLFWVEYAFLDWVAIARPTLRSQPVTVTAPIDQRTLRQVGLRWHVNAGQHAHGTTDPLGLPTGPFTVWRRDPLDAEVLERLEEPLGFVTHGGLTMGQRMVTFDRTVATARLRVDSPTGGVIFGLGQAPRPLSLLTWLDVPAGPVTIRMTAGRLNGLLLPPSMHLLEAHGSHPRRVAEDLEWEPVEIVGMPVDGAWSGVGDHLTDQGPVGALTDPLNAAHERIVRGTPPFGWHDHVGPGVLAPPWAAPAASGVIDEVHKDMLPRLREALSLSQAQQAAHVFTAPVPPPATLQGAAMSGNDTDAEVPTVALLQLAVAGDPFLSLALGYGTNVSEDEHTASVDDVQRGARFDYMVTAPYREGVVGDGRPVDLASLALRPRRVLPPPVAAAMQSEQRASLAPVLPDADWRASTTTRWDRALEMALVRTASHAVTRHAPGDPGAAALLEKRPSGGDHPIAPAVAPDDDQKNFVHYADRELRVPNDPGQRTVRYSVANQNTFGVWSAWRGATVTVSQPHLAPPRILAAGLDVDVPETGTACPATLTVDLAWDWTDRRPGELRLTGRMFAAADRAATAPIPLPPPGLEREIGVGGAAVVLTFSGDTAAMAGAPTGSALQYLDEQGEHEVPPGAAQGDGARRYRVRITGLVADFAATAHVGIALWASGSERIAPQRTVATAVAHYAYASDPIAPPVPPELVPLSSLPDAEGRSHAKVSWPPVPGAAAYVVYGSDEITMRSHHGMGEPDLGATLSDRVTELLDAWVADPDRRPFTRLVPRAVTGTSVDLTLPRGTTGISTFVIVSLSAGQVEGPWPQPGSPTLRDEVIVRATPRIAAPSTTELEARVDGQTVHLTVRTRPGHRAGRVEVHRVRVDVAARELDTMGPPVAQVSEGTPGWAIETDVDGTPLAYRGTDVPGPSWRRVWYRAVAWADAEWPVAGQPFPHQIAEQGLVPGRSPSSNAVSVTVPPIGPPDLSPLEVTWPGGSVADVQLTWTTDAPFAAPMGAHRTEVDVRASGGDAPLVAYQGTLAGVGVSPTSGDGLWRDDGSAPASFHAVIRRASVDVELDAIVRVIDPLGRATQRTVHVGAGSVLPAPDLDNLEIVVIAGRGIVLTFTSTSPIVEMGGQAYVLHVAATPTSSRPTFPDVTPFRPILPRVRPGPLLPLRPTEEARPAPEPRGGRDLVRPRPHLSPVDLPLRPRPLTLTVPLPDVTVDRGQPATDAPLQVRRTRGAGPTHAYAVLARDEISSFALRLRAPDGRTAEASKRVERP